MAKYTAVLFDLDGTLIDSASLVAASVQRTFRDFGLPEPEKEAVISYMGIPIEIYFEKLAGPQFSKINREDTYKVYFGYFREMLESGLLKPFEGVPAMLKALREAGIYTGIATSKRTEPAVFSCEKAGIISWIDVVIGSDMVTNYKPAPDTVYKCLDALGIEGGPQILVVGDAEADIAMGNNAGATTCGVTWGAHNAQRLKNQSPCFIADKLEDLLKITGL